MTTPAPHPPYRTVVAYVLGVGVPAIATVILVTRGGGLAASAPAAGARDGAGAMDPFQLVAAIGVVLGAARLAGWALHRIGQPAVIGEMVAGLLLGPSLLGAVLPAAHAALFPAPTLGAISAGGQLAVVLFMFVVGAELPLRLLRASGVRAVVLGQSMVAVPFLLAVLLAGAVQSYRPATASPLAFALFVGVACGVTAFPVLVRILAEHRLHRTPIGVVGVTAAGIGDITMWIVLALVVALARGGSGWAALTATGWTAVIAAGAFLVLRPLLRVVAARAAGRPQVVGLLLLVVAVGLAAATDRAGVHAVFGAFLAGIIVPRQDTGAPQEASDGAADVVQGVIDRAERLARLALPLFFASVGLGLRLGGFDGRMVLLTLAILGCGVFGKALGAVLPARLLGFGWRDSTGLGVMMNCRGLTELVVLNIGRSLHLISEPMFVAFLVLTLVTTAATGPLLTLVIGLGQRRGALSGRSDGPATPAVPG